MVVREYLSIYFQWHIYRSDQAPRIFKEFLWDAVIWHREGPYRLKVASFIQTCESVTNVLYSRVVVSPLLQDDAGTAWGRTHDRGKKEGLFYDPSSWSVCISEIMFMIYCC